MEFVFMILKTEHLFNTKSTLFFT